MINDLGWKMLAKRRAKSQTIPMYKIQIDLIDIPQNIFQPSITHNHHSQAVFETH